MYGHSHAKKRRSLANNEFNELTKCFPAPDSIKNNFDRLQLMRLINGYIKTKHFLHDYNRFRVIDHSKQQEIPEEFKTDVFELIKGFLMIISQDGLCLHVSENFVHFTGISTENIIGKSIYEFVYPADYRDIFKVIDFIPPHTDANIFDKIRPLLGNENKIVKTREFENSKRVSLLLRLKYSILTKGKRVRLGASEYKLFKFIGNLKRFKMKDGKEYETFVCVGTPLYFQTFDRPIMTSSILITRTNFDAHLIYTNECNMQALGYDNTEWVDKSFLIFVHGLDIETVSECYKNVISKYEADSKPFRLLLKTSGWIWFKSRCFMIYDKNECPTHILGLHEKLSELEGNYIEENTIRSPINFSLENSYLPTI